MPMFWVSFLPAWIRERIQHRTNLQKILSNTGWLFADKILRMLVGLWVTLWIARYLGPNGFGTLNYALAVIAILGTVATLGLNNVVVRELINRPDQANVIMGSAFLLQLLGGIVAYMLGLGMIQYSRAGDDLAQDLVMILGLGMMLKATDVVRYWFEAQVRSKYVVGIAGTTFVAVAAIKIGLILMHAPLVAFAWAIVAEGVLVALGLLGVYIYCGGGLSDWRARRDQAKALLQTGWPLVLSGLTVMIYMRIDQLMLAQMLGDQAVGIYSAAIQIGEAWYFIPMAIVASVFPSIIAARKHSQEVYYRRLQHLYNLMVILAVLVALPMTFLSTWVIEQCFGPAYATAGHVLAIHIWTGVFVFLGVASGSWYLAEGMQIQAFYRTLAGAVINIVANLVLIPRYGIAGAAIATILSQMMAAYVFDALHRSTRLTFWMKTKALFPFCNFKPFKGPECHT